MASIRPARQDEDELLARLLCNAFRMTWGMNYWQNLSKPLPQLDLIPPKNEQLSSTLAARLRWYRAFFPLARYIGGQIDVITPAGSDQPAAMSCILPPHVRTSTWSALLTGWVFALFRLGPRAVYRFLQTFPGVEKEWPLCLHPRGETYETGGFVLEIGTDPSHAGNGYGAKLLQWQIDRHWQTYPGVPVYLEAAENGPAKVYERLGFKELARNQIKIDGVDQYGIQVLDASTPTAPPYLAVRCMVLDLPAKRLAPPSADT